MRLIIALIVIVYLIGVGVVLAPTFHEKWNTAPAGELASNAVQALPDALAWPAKAYRGIVGRGAATGSAT